MSSMVDKIIETKFFIKDGIQIIEDCNGYWSNLDIDENRQFLKNMQVLGTRQAVKRYFPQYTDVIFSPKRSGGLIFLDPKPGEVIIDLGCMWGAVSVPLGKAGCNVIAIDKTLESLIFLKQRMKEENLNNIELVCSDLNKIDYKEYSFDKAVVNGVLEWLPEQNDIELKKYYGKRMKPVHGEKIDPYKVQGDFLCKIHRGLKRGGMLYLAIENRADIFGFLGAPDPHCSLKFITFMPRHIQNLTSRIFLGRPYLNWTYSPGGLKKILERAGFKKIDIYHAFPDYRFPDYIFKKDSINRYRPYLFLAARNRIKRIVYRIIEEIFFKRLKLFYFSPSLIAIAEK